MVLSAVGGGGAASRRRQRGRVRAVARGGRAARAHDRVPRELLPAPRLAAAAPRAAARARPALRRPSVGHLHLR